MTKYFCDRCGKEADYLSSIKVPKEKNKYGFSYSTAVINICKDCYNEYNRLERTLLPAITELRFAMFREFFMDRSDAE